MEDITKEVVKHMKEIEKIGTEKGMEESIKYFHTLPKYIQKAIWIGLKDCLK